MIATNINVIDGLINGAVGSWNCQGVRTRSAAEEDEDAFFRNSCGWSSMCPQQGSSLVSVLVRRINTCTVMHGSCPSPCSGLLTLLESSILNEQDAEGEEEEMTDTAYDAVQRLHSRRLVRSSKARSSLSIQKGENFALCVCGLGSAAAVIVTAVSLGVYFSSRGGQGQETSELWEFYPPEEAQELARYVNTSLNPCKDFFAYVCSSAINDAHSTRGDVDAELVRMAITGATPTGVEKGRVGRLLTAFYGTCVKTVPHRETFLAGMATALARSTWGRLGVPDTRNAFVYVVTVSVKYDLPSTVRVALERLRSVMLLKIGAVCGAERHTDLFEAALSASREALRAHDKATPSPRDAEDVKDLRLKSCERFAGVIREHATYTLANESDAFDREVWNVGDLHAALRAIGRPSRSVKRVVVEGVREIRILHDVFASDEVAVDVKAAYLVWESLARAAEKFYPRDVSSALGVFDKCVEGLFHVPHIWDAFAAEVIASTCERSRSPSDVPGRQGRRIIGLSEKLALRTRRLRSAP
ncbi:hypothetical protein HPB50_000505 [Hyalomma asiaticum]|uniref:Uncharacterized protein n=1 Tax=Hyalomma asiaticum TaxID=266040 RepID=A0ACB7RLM3_HYAAI|nr:hypothetical protein HPB50_000505 [Hyalomma asiaticum]